MRRIVAASLIAICGTLAGAPVQAQQWVSPIKGNDTGGIIAFARLSRMFSRRKTRGLHQFR